MNYFETIQFLFAQLPVFQRDGASAYKANLDNTIALDAYFQSPHKKFKSIHVGGTNGKGSVSHMLSAILQKAGYKTGLYTSPHLTDFRERIKINGQMISEEQVVEFVDKHQSIISHLRPSFFELTVAMAFDYFACHEVDIAVIEVGMGGRLDSTNIITPLLSVITNISLDHTQFLGNTLSSIATEKAGIIKPNIPVVIGEHHCETDPIFEAKTNELNAPLIYAQDSRNLKYWQMKPKGCNIIIDYQNDEYEYELDLGGIYQQKNLLTVLAATDFLKSKLLISNENIKAGISQTVSITGLKGRWQKIGDHPLIVCDTGHNQDGIKQIIQQIKLVPYKKLHFILGMVNDKDHSKILQHLPVDAQYYFTRASIPRSLNEKDLQKMALEFDLAGEVYNDVPSALAKAKMSAQPDDFIFIGGSTFIVADIPGL